MRFDVLELFGHDTVSTVLSVAIILLGLIATLYLCATTFMRMREINQAIAALENAADKQEFAQQFDVISARIETSRLLRTHWINFRSTLFFSREADTGAASVQSTTNVSEVFSLERINNGWRDERLLPGLFLSVAMLLAVVGAAASMTNALNAIPPTTANLEARTSAAQTSSNQTSDVSTSGHANLEAREEALRQFLNFGKSSLILVITGLIVSLSLTLALRTCKSRIRSSLHSFSNALQQRIVKISFEATVLGRLANISAASSGMDSAVNAVTANNLKIAIEQALPPQLEQVAEQLHSAIDHHSTLSAEAAQTTSDQLSKKIDNLISDQVARPIRSTNEQLQEQFLGLRENLLTLSNAVANNRNLGAVHGRASSDPASPEMAQLELSPFVEAAERVQQELASLNRSAIHDIGQDLTSKLDEDVVDPLRDMSKSVAGLKDNLAAIEEALASISLASPQDNTTEASFVDLAGKLQSLQATLENERMASNDQLIRGFSEQLEACVTQPVNEVSSNLERIRARFDTLEAVSGEARTLDNDAESFWRETLSRIESRLANLDVALSAANSLAASHSIFIPGDGGGGTILDQKQSAIDDITERLEVGVVAPLQELIMSTARLQQALSEDELKVANEMIASGDEVLASTKVAASNLREEIRALATQPNNLETSPTTFADRMLQCCEDLDRASATLVHNSAAIEIQLKQLTDLPADEISRKVDDGITASQPGTNAGASTEEPHTLPTDQRQTLSGTQQKALDILNTISADGNAKTSEDKITKEEINNAMRSLTKQVQHDWEIARRNLIDRIDRSDGVLEEMTRQWDQNSSTITHRFRQLIDAAPTDWSHTATEISSAAERTVYLVVGDTRQLFDQWASTRVSVPTSSELQQTINALDLISDHLVHQTVKSREMLTSQLAITLDIIERSSTTVFATLSGLGNDLSQNARAVAHDMLEALTKTSADLASITQESNELTLPALASLLHDANYARKMIKVDIIGRATQAEEIDKDTIDGLHETIFEIANTIASLSRNLAATTDRLIHALQAVANDIRLREGQFAMENPSLMEADVAAYTAGGPIDSFDLAAR